MQAAQAMKEADLLAHGLRTEALAVEARDRIHSAAALSASDAATAQLRALEQMELVRLFVLMLRDFTLTLLVLIRRVLKNCSSRFKSFLTRPAKWPLWLGAQIS